MGEHAGSPLLALGCAASVLIAACLACGRSGPDVEATVNAVSTAVEQTVAALTPPGPQGGETAAPGPTGDTATPRPQDTAVPAPGTATDFAPPSLTPPPSDNTATATPGALIRPNGPVIHAARRETPPTVDAQAGDWGGLPYAIDQIVFQPANWAGEADQSASFAAAWDATHLYLLVHVTDDVHVQTQHGELLYRGDSLEMQLDTDLAGDYAETSLSADDFQLGLSPGALTGDSPEAWLWNPVAHRGLPQGIALAARRDESGEGYWLEAAIPWSLFSLSPSAGSAYGFALNSSDNDTPAGAAQQSMISTVATRTLLDPTTWVTLVLD